LSPNKLNVKSEFYSWQRRGKVQLLNGLLRVKQLTKTSSCTHSRIGQSLWLSPSLDQATP